MARPSGGARGRSPAQRLVAPLLLLAAVLALVPPAAAQRRGPTPWVGHPVASPSPPSVLPAAVHAGPPLATAAHRPLGASGGVRGSSLGAALHSGGGGGGGGSGSGGGGGGGGQQPLPAFARHLIRQGYEVRPYHPPPASPAAAASTPAAWPARARLESGPGQAADGIPHGGGGPGAAAGRTRFGWQSLAQGWPADGGAGAPCSRAFTARGSKARPLAIILLKWRREYYPPREACCPGNADPACDCTWGGYKYDELPPPRAYENVFSDECDGSTSINRAYYRLSGGRVTFTTNATDPASAASGRVDVFGWATLDAMRSAGGECLDWCAEARRQLGVSGRSHRHYVCFPLYKPDQLPAPAVCDSACPGGGDCAPAASCPADGPYRGLPGCGCGTCYWAWGAQWSCGPVSQRRRHTTGFSAPTETWSRYGAVRMVEGHKVYMAHEIGHNLGLTHAGSMVCRLDASGAVDRHPSACRPDWYGDFTTFMGGVSSLTLPAYYKLQQGWLPEALMRTVKEVGRQATIVLRDHNQPLLDPPPAATTGALSANASGVAAEAAAAGFRGAWGPLDAVVARVPIDKALPGGYACPCAQGACAAAPACQTDEQCAASGGPCCVDAGCADGGFAYYYVEFARSPVPGDYGGSGDYTGVTVRLAGDLKDCASTRMVPTHVAGGAPAYVMNRPDPNGKLPGSWFEDPVRRVIIRLDGMGADWAQVSILRY